MTDDFNVLPEGHMLMEGHMLVDGRPEEGRGSFGVVNPATGDVFALCPCADEPLLNRTVSAAKRAFPSWAATPVEQRAAALNSLATALERRAGEFEQSLTREQGKPLLQARLEVRSSVYLLRAFAGMRPERKVLRRDGTALVIEHRTPLGVVAAIAPWNFPLLLMIQKIAPALVTGNTVVAKPAPTTPFTTLLLGDLCRPLLPPGVLNIICDENNLVGLLTAHPDVARIAFTGSTLTGRKVMQSAADTLKRVTLELAGNDAAIVMDDVDPAAVAHRVFDSAMLNSGQVGSATKRAYVPERMYDVFCDELVKLANAAVVDEGTRPGTQFGPLQNRIQFERVKEYLADARQHGRIIAGGRPLERPGYFVPPTIVRDIADNTRLVQEEQFGPILPVLKYADLDDVIERVNASDYGLGGTVWGRDVARATEIALRINSGTVWVNQHAALDIQLAIRGAKQSGIGCELGQDGLHEYTQAHIVNAVAL